MHKLSHSNQRPRRSRRPASSPKAFTFLALSSLIASAIAGPFPKDDLHDRNGNGFVMDSNCNSYCGENNDLCCGAQEHCVTKSLIASCSNTARIDPAADIFTTTWTSNTVSKRDYGLFTTTWTVTNTYTSTGSSYYAASTAAAAQSCIPTPGTGQIACGNLCCANWQYCAYAGQCSANVGYGSASTSYSYATVTATQTAAGSVITTQYSAPYRVTSGGTTIVGATTTAAPTTTATGTLASSTTTSTSTPVGTTVSNAGLSSGAIAGIVIGTLAGITLLIILCACCILRGLWHGVLDILGLRRKPKKSRSREEVIIEEERYTRRGGSQGTYARRDEHTGGWFGGSRPKPARSARSATEEKRQSGGNTGKWLGAAAVGTGILGVLGLKNNKKKEEKRTPPARTAGRSEISSGYYSDSYSGSDPSSVSSAARSHGTRGPRAASRVRTERTEEIRRVSSRAPSRR